MNKKFSTLVASLLLASGAGNLVYGQALSSAITFTETISAVTVDDLPAYNEVTKEGGYEVGKAYFLQTDATAGSEKYLVATETDGQVSLTIAGSETLSTLDKADQALWIVSSISAPAGAVAPKYVFVNKATKAVLAMDASKAVKFAVNGSDLADSFKNGVKNASNVLGGDQVEWLSAPSYKAPKEAPIYASISDDTLLALYKNDNDKVVLIQVPASELNSDLLKDNLVKVTPQVAKANSTFVLTPRQLNTMLGEAGKNATKDSYFQLTFSPEATMNGEDNRLAVDLQAMAVDQFELVYGEDGSKSKKVNVPTSTPAAYYASFHEKTSLTIGNEVGTTGSIYNDLVKWDNVNGFDAHESRDFVENTNEKYYAWYALRNREGQYLVVDTAYVDGTQQAGNGRITFAWDGLYNAKNNTRYRDPRSYLFQFQYNPQTGDVNIVSLAYVTKTTENQNTTTENATFYEAGYKDAVELNGSEWYAKDASNTIKEAYVTRAALGSVSEVTLGKDASVPTGNNAFKITLGNSAMYQPAYVASGVYLMKVTGSVHAERVGKYYINNLKGGFEIMEQAVRQNFQDMPAAQWVVKSTGTTTGSPVSIKNREFEEAPNANLKNVLVAGTVYGVKGAAGVQGFTMGSDTIEFIPVTNVTDKYLGYKYVANDTIGESLFTFNYLHDLAMDKPINTKNDVDSVVWVDKNGEAMKFILEAVADDTYGTNNGVSGVTTTLTRRIYKIKVNDATKLNNDKRYLTYDEKAKKYVVSQGEGDLFFIKENNEVEDGVCYYTLIKANAYPMVRKSTSASSNPDNAITSRPGWTVLDDAISNNDVFLAEWGNYYDKVDGLSDHKGWAVKLFSKEKDAQDVVDAMGYGKVQKIVENLPTPDDGSSVELKQLGAKDDDFNGKYVINFNAEGKKAFAPANYADYKVSVDNNTLDLVNGVLNNDAAKEVATSAFAVTRDANPLYRRFNTENEGVASDDPDVVKFYRVNAAAPEYLYEDANSAYSKDRGFNFLGVEGKGDSKNAAIYVDTAYVDRDTRMPQYLLALRPEFVQGEVKLCDATTHAHATEEEALACPHSKVTPSYTDAWYLINLQDSIDLNSDNNVKAKYQWNTRYTRLGFVKARHIGDTLVIDNSIYSDNFDQIKKGDSTTWASKDSIFLGDNKHKNVVFSFRLLKSGSDDFLIESETSMIDEDGKEVNVKNADLKAVKIAPMQGGWIKIQNGVPVIANCSYEEAGREAEVFNVEATDETPTANESAVVSEVSIVAANGAVIVKNAAGKKVAVSNILGQTLANAVVDSDNETIAVPAGIAVVAVEGEEAVKVVVK